MLKLTRSANASASGSRENGDEHRNQNGNRSIDIHGTRFRNTRKAVRSRRDHGLVEVNASTVLSE